MIGGLLTAMTLVEIGLVVLRLYHRRYMAATTSVMWALFLFRITLGIANFKWGFGLDRFLSWYPLIVVQLWLLLAAIFFAAINEYADHERNDS